ncbi:Histone acetyltransferase HAC1 [Hondaea fermentalgiana]|uniref:Histone acetyltransferase HAC1 n=1 Tax=Hondaea fermentalgiana TaxID=2315210 RepID=A0A2R5G4E4_9STRA|nr:Histone acetyltransferase HAC1 [Hondaea fermentalgiana]|eukprot:GBG25892.1 Histone acetyltransferase HAC1 [Hondaea fermentalgiana]
MLPRAVAVQTAASLDVGKPGVCFCMRANVKSMGALSPNVVEHALCSNTFVIARTNNVKAAPQLDTFLSANEPSSAKTPLEIRVLVDHHIIRTTLIRLVVPVP